MSTTLDLLRTSPADRGDLDLEVLAACIDACGACAAACSACAAACLSEEGVAELTACVSADLDCSEICAATLDTLTRHSADRVDITRLALELCTAACGACADECARHGEMHEHCRICSEECRRCEIACAALLDAL
ncbi:four-helix bundle copper-binding protein [Clavibacter michiganensis]|uniref:Four-helix bundle copper-binding protein n=1 Tax=Clavibacter michiganensis TaxID=28447 RepID=A0A2S5VRL4_9MICO|nr:four-helix bundle copper-binding protein [Clavibacter michiganensis]PPF65920.1 four-helix bundle copper-binding protein [Clavibacter michiganensis]